MRWHRDAAFTRLMRPNIVWLSMEDTSPRYGCYGDRLAVTPTCDRLAAEGVRFERAFSTAPVCAPARHAVITGTHAVTSGAHHMRTLFMVDPVGGPRPVPGYSVVTPPHVVPLPTLLRMAGYHCTNDSKTDYQFDPPAAMWDACEPGAHWRGRADGQPFFAVFNPTFSHESGLWDDPPPYNPDLCPEALQPDPADVAVPPYLVDGPRTRRCIARQYGNVRRDDDVFGEVVAQLESDGVLEDTVIFVWSDHGEGLPRAKRWLYDAGLRVPLIVRVGRNVPGWERLAPAGGVRRDVVSTIDLMPTVLKLCGLDVPRHLPGVDLLAGGRRYAFGTRDRLDSAYDKQRAVTDGRFKLIRHDTPERPMLQWMPYSNTVGAMDELWRAELAGELRPEQRQLFEPRPVLELYDTDADPHELTNLADHADLAEKRAELLDVLDGWCRRYDRYGDVPEAQMVATWWGGADHPPATAEPIVVVFAADDTTGLNFGDGAAAVGEPCRVMLHCNTQGAQLEYRADGGRWRVYAGPFVIDRTTTIEARASRIGFTDSDVVNRTVTVT